MKPAPTPVYICAPYSAPAPEGRALNVDRARALAELAVRVGLAPICIHGDIAAGVFGDDADPAQRARGLEAACALVAACPAMWIASVPDAPFAPWEPRLSPGMEQEMQVAQALGHRMMGAPWSVWADHARREGHPDLAARMDP